MRAPRLSPLLVATSLLLAPAALGAVPPDAAPDHATAAAPDPAAHVEPAPATDAAPDAAPDPATHVEPDTASVATAAPAKTRAAQRVTVEVEVGSTILWPTSRSAAPLLEGVPVAGGRVALGLRFNRHLGAHLALSGFSQRGTARDSVPTTLDTTAVSAGVTGYLPLVWRLEGVVALDVEARAAALQVDAGGAALRQHTWSWGLEPQAGVAATFPVAPWMALRFQALAGYAFRADTAFDRLVGHPAALLRADAPTRPLDLGAANLSGATLTLTLGARF